MVLAIKAVSTQRHTTVSSSGLVQTLASFENGPARTGKAEGAALLLAYCEEETTCTWGEALSCCG